VNDLRLRVPQRQIHRWRPVRPFFGRAVVAFLNADIVVVSHLAGFLFGGGGGVTFSVGLTFGAWWPLWILRP
jgi:hypothetical protein